MSASTHFPQKIYILRDVAQRFNYYAQAALPCEIGGIAKVEEMSIGLVVTDFEILPQEATGGTFEIGPGAMNTWLAGKVGAGLSDELHLWRSIIHSHPIGVEPYLSGTDVKAIKDMAGEGSAFSLIMTACPNARSTKWAMHYCESTEFGHVVVEGLEVHMAIGAAESEMRDEIVRHVGEVLVKPKPKPLIGKPPIGKMTPWLGHFSYDDDDDEEVEELLPGWSTVSGGTRDEWEWVDLEDDLLDDESFYLKYT